MEGDSPDMLIPILQEPIETEDQSGRYSYRTLPNRRDLFWPEAFLGRADLGNDYLKSLWKHHTHLQQFFESEDIYHFDVAQFLMLVTLAAPVPESGSPIYPGYKRMPQARRAMTSLCSRLSGSKPFLESVARALGVTPDSFQNSWSERIKPANETGRESFLGRNLQFPDPMDSKVSEW